MPASGTICGLRRIGPRRPSRRRSPASGKISVIRISLRRGAARLAAPTTVTRTIGAARQSVSHQRRRKPSRTRPAIPSSTSSTWRTRPKVVDMNAADPARPHPADLAHGHLGVADRVFAEVLGEVLLADLAERRVAGQFGIAFGDLVEERGGVDFVQFLRVGRQALAGLALVEDRLDPLRIRRRRDRRCRRRGPCRRRSRSARGVRARRCCGSSRGRSAAAARPASGRPPSRRRRHSRSQAQRTAAKTTKAPATSVYSGRNIAVTPKRKPGRSQAQAPRAPRPPRRPLARRGPVPGP